MPTKKVLTDLPDIVPLAKRNAELNLASARVEALSFGDPVPEDLDGVGLLLCADCVWRQELHAPLLVTLADGLQQGGVALVAYQAPQFCLRTAQACSSRVFVWGANIC